MASSIDGIEDGGQGTSGMLQGYLQLGVECLRHRYEQGQRHSCSRARIRSSTDGHHMLFVGGCVDARGGPVGSGGQTVTHAVSRWAWATPGADCTGGGLGRGGPALYVI